MNKSGRVEVGKEAQLRTLVPSKGAGYQKQGPRSRGASGMRVVAVPANAL